MAAALIDIGLSDMETFLSTFSPVTNSGVFTSPPRNIRVNIQPYHTSIDQLLDIRPFSATLAQTPKPRWRIWTGHTVSTTLLEWRMTQIEEVLELAVTMPGSFLCAIASDFISGTTFKQTQDDMHQKWVTTATKADGSRLTQVKPETLNKGCRLLIRYGACKPVMGMIMRVEDGQGRQVEEYGMSWVEGFVRKDGNGGDGDAGWLYI
jgi:hypothetical protein